MTILFGTAPAFRSNHGFHETTGYRSWFSVVGFRFSMGAAAPLLRPNTENLQPRTSHDRRTASQPAWTSNGKPRAEQY